MSNSNLRSKIFNFFDESITSGLYLLPIYLMFYHLKHHKSIELDAVLLGIVMTVRAHTIIELMSKNILSILGKPQQVSITDRTVDMGDVEVYIKAKDQR